MPLGAGLALAVQVRAAVILTLALAYYFIAANIGSGWIYLLSASLFTALACGFALPLLQVFLLRATVTVPEKAQAGESVSADVTLTRAAPAFLPMGFLRLSIEIEKRRKANQAAASPVLIQSLAGRWQGRLLSKPLSRGVHGPALLSIATSFPLGIFFWRRSFSQKSAGRITVYPATVAVNGLFLYRLKAAGTEHRSQLSARAPVRQSTYTRGVRDYVRGDSPRHVHWASSARTGRLLVREFEAEGLPHFDVRLDPQLPWGSAEQFELAVTTAASLLCLGHRLGLSPELALGLPAAALGIDLPACAPGRQEQMEILARIQVKKGLAGARLPAAAQPGRTFVSILPAGTADGSEQFVIEIADPAAAERAGTPPAATVYVGSTSDIERL